MPSYSHLPPFQLQNIFKQKQINTQDKLQSCKKRKKNNPRAEFQRQLHSSFSPAQRLPQHLTQSRAARRRGPRLSLYQPPPARHPGDHNRLRLWLSSRGHGPASVLTKNCFLLLGYPSRMASSSSVAWRDRACEGCGQRSRGAVPARPQHGPYHPLPPAPLPAVQLLLPAHLPTAPGQGRPRGCQEPRAGHAGKGSAGSRLQTGPGFRHSSCSLFTFSFSSGVTWLVADLILSSFSV